VLVPSLAPALDLSTVEAFADLPDDARDAFARAARVERLAKDEEVATFALALVIEGSVDVQSPLVDAAAERVAAGTVLRSRGTLEEPVAMRLVCASDGARVAVWDDAAVEEAFRTCTWVEDDLRAASDRIQALVGLTVGPLGERLDASLRAQVTTKLALRTMPAGEIFATRGGPIPGLLVVGAGELELVKDESPAEALGPGEFLFAGEFLAHSPAPATARAGKGGALVLVADRMAAQELLVTCPPLLEIFSGS
jgi:CRP-like cAMP-binding protein